MVWTKPIGRWDSSTHVSQLPYIRPAYSAFSSSDFQKRSAGR